MRVVYEHQPARPRLPFLIIEENDRSYFKVLLRGRFLHVSHGTDKLVRENGEVDIPFVGAGRQPIGDFVYTTADEARSVFERFKSDPDTALRLVQTGRKP